MQANGVQVNKFAQQPYIIFRLWACFIHLRAPELPTKHSIEHISDRLLPFNGKERQSASLYLLVSFYPTLIPYASIMGFPVEYT